MISRDTRVHLVVLALAVLAYQAAVIAFSVTDVEPAGILGITFAAVVYGGAHAYLLWRSHDGMVPVESRLRFVGVVVAICLLALAGTVLDTSGTVFGVRTSMLLLVAGGLTFVAYWLLEARSGYDSSRESRA